MVKSWIVILAVALSSPAFSADKDYPGRPANIDSANPNPRVDKATEADKGTNNADRGKRDRSIYEVGPKR